MDVYFISKSGMTQNAIFATITTSPHALAVGTEIFRRKNHELHQ